MNRVTRNIIRFFVLVVLQVLVFNNIQFSGFINPYFYVLLILLLPFETPKWSVLFIGFAMGITIDLFSHTIGMHAMATLTMSFFRPYVLQALAPRDGYDKGTYPRVHYMGMAWFTRYSLLLIFIHHLVIFYLEIFRFSDFFSTLFRVILSTVFTFLFILISQFFIYRK